MFRSTEYNRVRSKIHSQMFRALEYKRVRTIVPHLKIKDKWSNLQNTDCPINPALHVFLNKPKTIHHR